MKITKQRLKEIIKEELEAPEEGPPICEPASDPEGLGWQIAKLLMDSDFGEDVYGAIVDQAYDFIEADPQSQGAAVEIDPGGAPFRRVAKVGASKKQGDPVGFQETIRQMVREALGAPQPRKYSFKEGSWAVRRSGTAEYLVHTRNGLDWGPKEKALTQLFEPEAWGIRKAAELGQSATSILDGIEHADIVDLSEPEEPEEDSDDPGLELSAPTIPQLKKLGYNPYK